MKNELGNGRRPNLVNANSSADEIIKHFASDFITVHDGFGFDLKKIAAHSASVEYLGKKTERRRLGNNGSRFFWRFSAGTMVVDPIYVVDMYLRSGWSSISLAAPVKGLGLPPKLEGDNTRGQNTNHYDVTKISIYNMRNSDLYALVIKSRKTSERLYTLAGILRNAMWDAIAGNTRHMVHCYNTSMAVSMNRSLNTSTVDNSDNWEFKGGFVIEPVLGCYNGVIVIDDNLLYSSIVSKVGIKIDRCVPSKDL
ncbi:hypothetical protein NX059_012433 [Plenodomus lindquistii]|nr:hypothetical protein NX059_012433 [Plenodomus lindquistii]